MPARNSAAVFSRCLRSCHASDGWGPCARGAPGRFRSIRARSCDSKRYGPVFSRSLYEPRRGSIGDSFVLRLLMALLDPPGRFPFHQIGQPLMPRYLWPLEQVFQRPMLVLGILFLWLECSSFRPVVDAHLIMRRPFAGVRNRFPLANVKIASNTAQLLDIPPKQSSRRKRSQAGRVTQTD